MNAKHQNRVLFFGKQSTRNGCLPMGWDEGFYSLLDEMTADHLQEITLCYDALHAHEEHLFWGRAAGAANEHLVSQTEWAENGQRAIFFAGVIFGTWLRGTRVTLLWWWQVEKGRVVRLIWCAAKKSVKEINMFFTDTKIGCGTKNSQIKWFQIMKRVQPLDTRPTSEVLGEVFEGVSIIGALITWDDDFSTGGKWCWAGLQEGGTRLQPNLGETTRTLLLFRPKSKLNLFGPKEMGRSREEGRRGGRLPLPEVNEVFLCFKFNND